ncbi:TonB-dependent receptor [Compostibacter hankyongensis]|uniref:TonB-dependent receptor n=1 Tax=Compostibacter hankyongensis TaxID=1007089 RepID=A0ABP8G1I7_9BACT
MLLLATCIPVSAHAYAQKVTLVEKNISLKTVFREIRRQTGYNFIYSDKTIRTAAPVTLVAEKMPLEDVLEMCFAGQRLTYALADKMIIVKPGPPFRTTLADKTIRGQVRDSLTGKPLSGVTLQVKGSSTGTVTDAQGNYSLDVAPGAILVVSYLGYNPKEVPVGALTVVNITLASATTGLNQLVVVGYGTQKKATLTGAVSAISAKEIVTTKNENPQNMLTGKIPGVRVVQRTAEPGTFNNAFDIRGLGAPLIVIDGVPRTAADFQRLNANDIDNISVLKDASAAIYGVRAANGVVLVTTKKGTDNKSTLTYDGNYMWQFPSGLPKTVDIYQYMTLRNEQAMHNINGGSPVFDDQQFEDYRSGKKQSTDWYPLVFSAYAPQTQHNLSATGGNDKIQYYVGAGYLYQGSFFKSNDLNYSRYNLRTNITAEIARQFTLDAGINLVTELQNRPYQDSWWIIRGFWRQGPQIPAYANNDPTKPFQGLIEGDNPVSFMDKDLVGYRKFSNSWIQPNLGLKFDVPGIKGLYARTLFSYDYSMNNWKAFQREYQQYQYDEASQTFSTFTRQSPNRLTREAYFRSQVLSQTSLNYSGLFDRHQVSGTMVWEVQKRTGDNLVAQRDLALPLPYLFAGVSSGQIGTMNTGKHNDIEDLYENTNMGLAGRFDYSYADKYLAEFLFRYDGSSKFGPGYQWGFFPGGSVGWRLSEESFIKNSAALSFVNQLKLRASYGVTGDDGASTYQWTSGYNYPSATDRRNFTGGYVFDGNFIASANSTGISNPEITWYTSKTFDVGIDFEGWNGLLGFTVDYFNRKREGLLAQRNGGIPTVVGAALPQENLNGDMSFGYDLEVSHRNTIGALGYNLKAIMSYTRIKALYVERGAYGSSWSNWRNNQNDRYQGVWWGYTSAGRYDSWEDIWSSPTYIGRGTVPGDYKYEDWNGDGEINGLDSHPYQTGTTSWMNMGSVPWMNFSLIGSATFKGFDLNFLLQGAAMATVQYVEQLYQPLWGNSESAAMVQFMDRWHPADPKADPYDPATTWISGHYAYTGTLPDVASSYNSVDGSYLRLKSIELGYTLPSQTVSRWGLSNVRVYVNGYNLVTFTKVKYVDPEHPNDTYGYLYPLNKTVSAGLSVTF